MNVLSESGLVNLELERVSSKDIVAFDESLQNNYLISAITALSEYPNGINNFFVSKESSQLGVYSIKFTMNGEPVTIIIDDYIPTSDDIPIFSRGKAWVMLVEKAWAKMRGSYKNMGEGEIYETLRDLTSAPSYVYDLSSNTDHLFM